MGRWQWRNREVCQNEYILKNYAFYSILYSDFFRYTNESYIDVGKYLAWSHTKLTYSNFDWFWPHQMYSLCEWRKTLLHFSFSAFFFFFLRLRCYTKNVSRHPKGRKWDSFQFQTTLILSEIKLILTFIKASKSMWKIADF